jgi:signal transduction histidine kinase
MDAWLERVYERHRARYPALLLGGAYLIAALIIGPGLAVFPIRYEGLSLTEAMLAIGVVEVGGLGFCLVGGLACRNLLRALSGWAAEPGNDVQADAARRAAFALPGRFIRGGLAVLPIGPAFVAAVTVPVHHTAAVDFVEIAWGEIVAGSFLLLAMYLLVDVGLRPVRAALRADAQPERTTRLAYLLTAVVVFLIYIGFTAGGFWVLRRGHTASGRLLEVSAVATAFTAFSVVIVAPLLSGSVIGPLRTLIGGTRAVSDGSLTVTVPVTSRDELGELAASFNTMVHGLRERSELREQNAALVDELRASRSRVVAAADTERRAIERDLHDGAQQQLVLVGLKLQMAGRLIDSDPARARALHGELRADLQRALAELRELAHGIYPPLLESEGLRGALAEAAERAAIGTTVECDGIGRYSSDVEAAVYFCCREALQNAAKHAGDEARARVKLSERDHVLSFEVLDDGLGFDPAATRASAGMQNMTDRIGALGGTLDIQSAPGQGTAILGTVPLSP